MERKVFEQDGAFYCLIETGGSNGEHDEAVGILRGIEAFLTLPGRKCLAFLST